MLPKDWLLDSWALDAEAEGGAEVRGVEDSAGEAELRPEPMAMSAPTALRNRKEEECECTGK